MSVLLSPNQDQEPIGSRENELAVLHEKRLARQKEYAACCVRKLNLPPRFAECTLANYTANNDGQHAATKACHDFLGAFPGVGGMAFLGGVGTGKTHLAAAICLEVAWMGKESCLTTVSRIIRRIRGTWSKECQESENFVMEFFRRLDLLVIDEVGVQYGTPSEQLIISEIINDRYEDCRPSVVIGNTTMSELKAQIGVRAVDRIVDGGWLVPFSWESYRSISSERRPKKTWQGFRG